jgi:hypothetical protein
VATLTILTLIGSILFLLNYTVEYKYTIDDGFSNTKIFFLKKDRGIEIESLLWESRFLIAYLVVVILYLWTSFKHNKIE